MWLEYCFNTPVLPITTRNARLWVCSTQQEDEYHTPGLALAGIGMGEAFILEGGADGAVFEISIEQILAPSLQAGQIVILDNLNTHTGERIRHSIEVRGCQLLFLPSYSPDLSPIEEAFSKLKAVLRRVRALTPEALQEAIGQALLTITPHDARGWFTHCGYNFHSENASPERGTDVHQLL